MASQSCPSENFVARLQCLKFECCIALQALQPRSSLDALVWKGSEVH